MDRYVENGQSAETLSAQFTILIVEDELTLADTLEYNLLRQGYKVLVAADGYRALDLARAHQPDLVILDIMLPGLDGFEVCRTLRQEGTMTILMLTARTDEVDKIVGLEMGADDYMTKPFSMRELTARVKAHLRRVRLMRDELTDAQIGQTGEEVVKSGQLVIDDLLIDLDRHEVFVGSQHYHMKPMEFSLLVFLVRNRGIVLSRDTLLERVWGWDYNGGSRTVDVHIRWLREKIEADPTKPRRIITVRGVGYRFEK